MPPKGGIDASTTSKGVLDAARCDLQYSEYDQLDQSSAYWSPSSAVLVQKRGRLLGGSDPLGFPFKLDGFESEAARKKFVPTADGKLKVASCAKKVGGDDDVTWRWQQVGPFSSTGGMDWWNLYFRDIWALSKELPKVPAGKELGVSAHFHSFVDSSGNIVPLPPLHAHHVHIAPGTSGDDRLSSTFDCYLRGTNCREGGNILIQQDGDYQCHSADGGEDCLAQDYGPFVKNVYEPITYWSQLNDARPNNSTALTWWYLAVVRTRVTTPSADARPTSCHLIGDGVELIPRAGYPPAIVFYAQKDRDSFIWWQGRMPFAGALAGLDFHAHMLQFWGATLLQGSASAIGVARWDPISSTEPTLVSTTGFGDNEHLYEHIVSNLDNKTAQVVCDVRGNTEVVEGVRWDRRASIVGCKEWVFADAEPFLFISFNGAARDGPAALKAAAAAGETGVVHVEAKGFSGMAGPGAKKDGSAEKPPELDHYPEHAAFLVYYVAADRRSHYTFQVYGTHLDDVDIVMSRRTMVRHFFNGGLTPNRAITLMDRMGEACAMSLAWFVEKYDTHQAGAIDAFMFSWPAYYAKLLPAMAVLLLCVAVALGPWEPAGAGGAAVTYALAWLLGLVYFVFCTVALVYMTIPAAVFYNNKADAKLLRSRHRDNTESINNMLVVATFFAGWLTLVSLVQRARAHLNKGKTRAAAVELYPLQGKEIEGRV